MTTPPQRVAAWQGWARQLLVVAYLCLLVGLGIRSLLRDDARFGWGMFGADIEYLITYEWLMEDGTRQTYFPGAELRGRAGHLRPKSGAGWFAPRSRHSRMGLGTLCHWTDRYLQFLFEERRPAAAVGVQATIHYARNQPLVLDRPVVVQDPSSDRPLILEPPADQPATAQTLVRRHPVAATGEPPNARLPGERPLP